MRGWLASGKAGGFSTDGNVFLDRTDRSATRTLVKPLDQLVDGIVVATGAHFHATVSKVDGMACQVQRNGDVPCANSEEDALYPSFDYELTTHGKSAGAA